MQRRSISDAENRLLILYALKAIGPMTDHQLLVVMADTDLMNYFTLQLTLSGLETDGKVCRCAEGIDAPLRLTDAGRYLLSSFETRIPQSRRTQIDTGAAKWQERFLTEQMASAELYALPTGETGLHLRIVDHQKIILDLSFRLPDGRTIDRLSQRWQTCMNQAYLLLLSALSTVQTEHPSLPEGCSTTQVGEAEWLMTACDHASQPTITLLLSLPGEELAKTCAASFQLLGSAIRDMMLALLDGAISE